MSKQNETSIKDIDEMIDQIQTLITASSEVACVKLDDLRTALQDPKYIKTVLRTKEKELLDNVTGLLTEYSRIKRFPKPD
jgi:hypothetical protein